MEVPIAGLAAFLASMLTFFSGFGLGTVLTPVFILFFPIEIAVAMTAVVHFLNNLFKLGLVGRHIRWSIALKFGTTAILGAFGGAWLLANLSDFDQKAHYSLGEKEMTVSYLQVILGILIFTFSLFEVVPFLKNLQFRKSWLLPGGLLSGFFGGLSGHQGALRSAFLIKFNLTKEQFIATGVVIACFVDAIRITTYAGSFEWPSFKDGLHTMAVATVCAFAGALLGKWMLKKITIHFVQYAVAIFMMMLAFAMIAGLI